MKAKETYLTQRALFKEYLVDAGDDAAVTAGFNEAMARAKTTKYECLVLKSLMATSKTLAKHQDSINKHFAEHARFAKVDAKQWFFEPLFKEAQRVLKLRQ